MVRRTRQREGRVVAVDVRHVDGGVVVHLTAAWAAAGVVQQGRIRSDVGGEGLKGAAPSSHLECWARAQLRRFRSTRRRACEVRAGAGPRPGPGWRRRLGRASFAFTVSVKLCVCHSCVMLFEYWVLRTHDLVLDHTLDLDSCPC